MPLQRDYQQNPRLPSGASRVLWDSQCTVKAVSRMGKLSGFKLPIHGQNNHLIVKGKNKLSEIKGCRSS